MKPQVINCNWLRTYKFVVYLSVLVFMGCGAGGMDPPPHAPVAGEDYSSLEPSYTAYTNEIPCKQFSQLMIMDKGRQNLGLMVGAFMTGVNYQKNRTSSATISQLLASVNLYCMDHPKDSVTKAMVALDNEIDKGLLRSLTTEQKSEQSKQIYRKKTKKAVSQVVPDTGQSKGQAKVEKSSVKPKVKRKVIVLPKTDPAGTNVVQVMSSKDVKEAQLMAKKLKAKGFPAFVVTVDLGVNGTWHRVLIGPYIDKTPARKIAELLKKFNFKAFVRQRQ